jgi:tetratricopeptide (TPR) repeat protein
MMEFHVILEREGDETFLTISSNGIRDKRTVCREEINTIESLCESGWHQLKDASREIGQQLFNLLNGDRQLLVRAIKDADDRDEHLHIIVQTKNMPDLPFELLYDSKFLIPEKIHLIRRVSDRGTKKPVCAENRSLRLLFMACSPEKIERVLDFEKEEDKIFDVTRNLPIEMDVEDSGSLEGLGDTLTLNQYDVIHISGHASVDKAGMPYFMMEDEEGNPVNVTPSQLWEKLKLNPPKLLFLSGCRTGQITHAAYSFAHQLVEKYSVTVLGWGLPVSDPGATIAAEKIYFELSRGNSIPDAVSTARETLFKKNFTDWSLLRLFSDGTPLTIPLVTQGQKLKPKQRELQYTYLVNSRVKVLKKGFIGRRKQIQRGIRILEKDEEKIGLLLHGTGGLGKSCLAGKFCDRFYDHTLIIVHGEVNEFTFAEALKDAFYRADDREGLDVLREREELPEKIRRLCSACFQSRNYLIILDDFEKNLERYEEGNPVVSFKAAPILEALLQFLVYTGKMTQMIVTSRYTFSFTVSNRDLIDQRLEKIGLTSFESADEKKKINELHEIAYADIEIRQQLIDAGHGNPRLMEIINSLLKMEKGIDTPLLLKKIKGKQEEFIQNLLLKEIFSAQPEKFQRVLYHSSVFRLPALQEGIKSVCGDIKDWLILMESAVQLSLMEEDTAKHAYWVTPLLREELFSNLQEEEKISCHEGAVNYYSDCKSLSQQYDPLIAIELIFHALHCGMDETALKEGGELLPYLREILAYREALSEGENILFYIKYFKKDEFSSKFFFEFGGILYDTGKPKKALKYYKQALSIRREVYGERHLDVATTLSNIGLAWNMLKESKKAIKYYEQALSIVKEVYGERHPRVATILNNIGGAWHDLGDMEKAIHYYKQALLIDREVYGERHPRIATTLNNIGLSLNSLGKSEEAIEYYEQALSITREVYGERHPRIATTLNNIGLSLNSLGKSEEAIEYYEQALSITREVYGERHPDVAKSFYNIGLAWYALEDLKKAIEYLELAFSIEKEIYGERHSHITTTIYDIGSIWYDLGDSKKAIEYLELAFSIGKETYGIDYLFTKKIKALLEKIKNSQ